jgi:squalene-associated FAD-dependent desaturase
LRRLTIVGGGWAGLAAAVRATEMGWQVALLEAAPTLGGRARRIEHQGLVLDNGPHLLIGAYTHTLALMRQLGLDPERLLWRMPLNLRNPQGIGLALPDLPPPWNLLWGISASNALDWRDKLSLLRVASRWQRDQFTCPPRMSVHELCLGLRPRVISHLIEPLCVSALNTPTDKACATVFLRVLQDALYSAPGSADFLLPRSDMSALLPDAALAWLRAHGAQVVLGQHQKVCPQTLSAGDAVLLACPACEAARLTQEIHPAWSAQAAQLKHEGIATVYLRCTSTSTSTSNGNGLGPAVLPRPMVALDSGPNAPAQFVFDRGALSGDPAQRGILAAVVSASQGDRESISQAVLAQVQTQLGMSGLEIITTVVERRATFSCTPGLVRPPARIAPGLWACGDHVRGPYPATLEGAVRSGLEVVNQLTQG